MTEQQKDELIIQMLYALKLSAIYLRKADNEGLMSGCVITPGTALKRISKTIEECNAFLSGQK